ncbi:MAG: hypothetical protein IJI13_04780 [Oscillospiraceae bacterium]|nr:hypothetical protein [Oscillospiraceae bacterium]
MRLEQEKKTAKFLDSRLDDETAAKVEKWNLALLGLTLAHDADQSCRPAVGIITSRCSCGSSIWRSTCFPR